MEQEKKQQQTMEDAMRLEFGCCSQNEAFARVAVAAFVARANPTVEQIEDIKTAVSEAVTNAIVHGYQNCEEKKQQIIVTAVFQEDGILITVEDQGVGIEDISLAKEPFYTTVLDGSRSGMGFCLMEAFMDKVDIWSEKGNGTRISMWKRLESEEEE